MNFFLSAIDLIKFIPDSTDFVIARHEAIQRPAVIAGLSVYSDLQSDFVRITNPYTPFHRIANHEWSEDKIRNKAYCY
ncbi:MAG: hypothetical protein LBT42_09565 [Tannerella sp.]|nr:hypothetical protein [Tannerella sp.]